MKTKKCPMCKKHKEKSAWSKGGWEHITYCKPCMKIHNERKRNKEHDKIMKATNNGECWWLLQSINAQRHYRKEN